MRAPRVAIVNSGGANIASLQIALRRLGADSELTSDAKTIAAASHVILPGVGTAADAMERLRSDGMIDTISKLTKPVLGICLGMQLLAASSAENNTSCLALVPAEVDLLSAQPGLPVPNMGWCSVRTQQAHPLFAGIEDDSYFYFVHSYAVMDCEYTIATACHDREFAAVFQYENYCGAQFHPERSAKTGARFLANFLDMET